MATRTTLTLDDDVAAGIARQVRRSGRPIRVVVNDALRAGLEVREAAASEPFIVEADDLGLRPGLELDHVGGLVEQVEGTRHR